MAVLASALGIGLVTLVKDESQRALAAARIATLQRGRPETKSPIGEIKTQAEAAQILNVGKRSVERARDVLDQGEATLVKAGEQGKVSVSAAIFVSFIIYFATCDRMEIQ